jgi:hypothetical protein
MTHYVIVGAGSAGCVLVPLHNDYDGLISSHSSVVSLT